MGQVKGEGHGSERGKGSGENCRLNGEGTLGHPYQVEALWKGRHAYARQPL